MNTELKSLIAKLNPMCRKALEKAAELCVTQTHYTIEIEHLFLTIMEPPHTDTSIILEHYQVPINKLYDELNRVLDRLKRGNDRTPAISPHIITLLREAWSISTLQLNSQSIRSGALWLAALNHDVLRGSLIESLPALLKIARDSLQQDLSALLQHSREVSDTPVEVAKMTTSTTRSELRSATPALDQYTLDLTQEARSDRLDPVEGREAEIRQVIDILIRRRQNNPILTGHAGVGKTAIVEGFAIKIAKGDVPPILRNTSVRVLDLGLLQAGAGVKGEFENRFKSVINEVKASLTPVILFIDEIHTIIGAGGQPGQSDAANLLKPALARGELRTIGATTWSEYKTYFEKDKALTRRFQVVKVDEPNEKVATTMLRSVVPRLERHHQVRILDEAVHDAVRLSHRYISDRYLPDKAVSVLDTACARVAIAQNSTPPALEAVQHHMARRQEELRLLQREQKTGKPHETRTQELMNHLTQLNDQKTQLESHWQAELNLVKKLAEQEHALEQENEPENLAFLQRELGQTQQELETLQKQDPMIPAHVNAQVIAQVISGWTGIPVGKMLTNEIATILNIQEKMAERIVGQDLALEAIARRIKTYRANLDDPKKPTGVFLLVGPSGVGKTETGLTLAELLYGGEHNVITVNMSEYQEAHTISSLRGSPPGYVGYGKGGILTEAVRRNPYSVVLLDEIEKAHSDVLELFYQVFDKGTLEDGEGVVVDFKNTLILMTSNAGSETIVDFCQRPQWNPEELQEALQEALHMELLQHFQASFLGRLIIVPYYPLGEEEIHRIVHLKLAKIQQRFLETHHAQLSFDEQLISMIAARCTEVTSGARNIEHLLTDTVLPVLSVEILERMANEQSFSKVQITCDAEGFLSCEFSEEGRASSI